MTPLVRLHGQGHRSALPGTRDSPTATVHNRPKGGPDIQRHSITNCAFLLGETTGVAIVLPSS